MKNAATKRAPQQPLSTSDATDFLIKYKEAWETHNATLPQASSPATPGLTPTQDDKLS